MVGWGCVCILAAVVLMCVLAVVCTVSVVVVRSSRVSCPRVEIFGFSPRRPFAERLSAKFHVNSPGENNRRDCSGTAYPA